MLELSWEGYATAVANAPTTAEFIAALDSVVQSAKIDLSKPARVVYCRDTRPSGEMLVSALKDGLSAMGAETFDAGVTTTPILHYIVRETNATGDLEKCGEPLIPVYYKQLSECTKKLLVSGTLIYSVQTHLTPFLFLQAGRPKPPSLIVDCANGVGTYPASEIAKRLADTFPLILENISVGKPGALNDNCGADYVKTTQKLPPSMSAHVKPGRRGCSYDGDADRLIYYYLDSRGLFHMLDGDKIAALVAGFIVDLVKSAGLDDSIKVGVVQTAYANGSSTKYLVKVLLSLPHISCLRLTPFTAIASEVRVDGR
jgi:phosphoacetylglucosamine mutase